VCGKGFSTGVHCCTWDWWKLFILNLLFVVLNNSLFYNLFCILFYDYLLYFIFRYLLYFVANRTNYFVKINFVPNKCMCM
jgi:hypothetical protein